MFVYKFHTKIALVGLMLLIGNFSGAHNQSPASIRRAMKKAFNVLEAPVPPNVFKGQSILHVAGAGAQVFDVQKEGVTIGKVVQLENGEIIYVLVFAADGLLKSVIRDNVDLASSEWSNYSFIEEAKGLLFPKKK